MSAATSPKPSFILASASPRRLQLLRQIGLVPDDVIATDIDETWGKDELPRQHALRLCVEKANAVAPDTAFVLAADTLVAVGRRVLPKTEDEGEARSHLSLLSGRAHHVLTAVALKCPDQTMQTRLVDTRVTFKRLSTHELEVYLAGGEWRGKAGAYAIQGAAAQFVSKMSGSYSNVVGLPLHETANLLQGNGFPLKYVSVTT